MPTLVFTELLGIFAVYMGIFGDLRPRGTYPKILRVAATLTFVAVGSWFFWVSISDLHKRETGDGTAILTFLITASVLALVEIRSWRKFDGWRSWPVTEATIQDVQIRDVRTRHNHYFVADAAYSYEVNGEFFSGYCTRDFPRESDAWDYANRVRGSKIYVRYHPHHADRSKLDAAAGLFPA